MDFSLTLLLLVLFNVVHGLLPEVRPVWFSHESTGPQFQQPNQPPLVIFLHGRLEAETGSKPFAPPVELYGDFCRELADQCQDSLLLLEFDELLSKFLRKEPRDFRFGPVSSALAQKIQQEVFSRHNNNPNVKNRQLVLVTFSMGAAMALKLLHNSHELKQTLTHLVLIEPVWRCWLPFAVANPRHIISNDDDALLQILALYGTNDSLTRNDSNRSVLGSLRQFLPTVQVLPLQGGNHWGILSEEVAGEIAREELDISLTPAQLRNEMIHHVSQFCGWEGTTD